VNVSRFMQNMKKKTLVYLITISDKFAELQSVSVFSTLSVFLIATTRIPHLKFSWNLIFDYVPEICGVKPRSFEIWQTCRVFCKRNSCSYHNIPSVILEIRNDSSKFVKNQEAHSIACLIFPKRLPIWNTVRYTAEGNKPKVKI